MSPSTHCDSIRCVCGLRVLARASTIQCACGRLIDVEAGIVPVSASASVKYREEPCVHLGAKLRDIECSTCGDRGEVKTVYACRVHGECTLRKVFARPSIESCLTCGNYEEGRSTRVCILTPFLIFGGGVEQWMHSLIKHMPAGVEFSGIGLLAGGSHKVVYDWDQGGIKYILPRAPVYIGGAACRTLVKQSDIVISWGVESLDQWVPDIKVPTIFTVHGECEWSRRFVTKAKDWATRIVAVSDSAAAICPEGVTVIHNGIDAQRCYRSGRLRRAIREQAGIPQNAFVVGQFGRIVGEKDPQGVGRAVAALGEKAWGLLAGWGHQHEIDEAKRLAGGRLSYLPPTADIAGLLSAMDVFLLGSRAEGFCLAIVEAWAAGIPTVTTQVGIVRDHPHCSIRIPYSAHGSTLAAAVKQAAGHENRWRIKEARQVSREYTAEQMAAKWHKLFKEMAQ